MASHFKWYPAESEIVVPFNARYSFPSQSNKAVKMTPRIPPKNAQTFSPGNVIRLEFPAQGYVNPGKTTLEFDVQMLYTPNDGEFSYVRFQNNIQSIFNRVRLLYGATPIEDIPYYNVIVRQLTEWTGTNQQGVSDQCSISEGIGGTCYGVSGQQGNSSSASSISARVPGVYNARQKYIHGIDLTEQYVATGSNPVTSYAYDQGPNTTLTSGHGLVPNGNSDSTALTAITGSTPVIHQKVERNAPIRSLGRSLIRPTVSVITTSRSLIILNLLVAVSSVAKSLSSTSKWLSVRRLKRVVFPAPLGPTSATHPAFFDGSNNPTKSTGHRESHS
jgi:hypothetical protein